MYGSRFSWGANGTGLKFAFDGTNYLAIWTDPFPFFASGDTNGIGDLHGQFISPSGSLVGTTFNLVTGVNIKFGQGRGELIFNGADYILLYEKGGNYQDHLYGQLIDKSGNLVGSPIQISSSYARDMSIGFDGTNYLTAWCEESQTQEDNVYGQFLSNQGTLVGSNFLIDGSRLRATIPCQSLLMAQDIWWLFMTRLRTARWNLFGRFISPIRHGCVEQDDDLRFEQESV